MNTAAILVDDCYLYINEGGDSRTFPVSISKGLSLGAQLINLCDDAFKNMATKVVIIALQKQDVVDVVCENFAHRPDVAVEYCDLAAACVKFARQKPALKALDMSDHPASVGIVIGKCTTLGVEVFAYHLQPDDSIHYSGHYGPATHGWSFAIDAIQKFEKQDVHSIAMFVPGQGDKWQGIMEWAERDGAAIASWTIEPYNLVRLFKK